MGNAIPIPRKGVKIFLEPKAKVPEWTRSQLIGEIKRERFYGGRMVRSIKVPREAVVVSLNGEVSVLSPETRVFHEAFSPNRVLEVRDFDGKLLIKRNNCLCDECGTLNGQLEYHDKYEDTLVSFIFGHFKCAKCGHEYNSR